MGKPSTPKAPDYAAAAKEQGAANLNSALATNYLNQANQVTPQGTLTYSYDKTGGQVLPDGTVIPQTTVTTSLSPEQQRLYDQNIQMGTNLNDLAIRGIDYVGDATANPLTSSQFGARSSAPDLPSLINYQRSPLLSQFSYGQGVPNFDINQVNPTNLGDFSFGQQVPGLDSFSLNAPNYSSSFGDAGSINSSINPNSRTSSGPLQFDYGYGNLAAMPSADSFGQDRDYVTNLFMQRLQPMIDREQSALDTKLANQGINLGSEAFRDAQFVQGQRLNDQRIAALLAGSQEQQRLFQDAMAIRQQGVGELTNQGNYYNAARGQEFGQNLASSEADFAQRLSALGFGNQAQQQQFGQLLSRAQFGNQAASQGFQDQMAAAGFGLSQNAQRLGAQQQAYEQALNAAGFNKDNALQRFQMGLASQANLMSQQQQALQAQEQGYNQAIGTAGFNNATSQAQFAQDQSANNFANNSNLQAFQSGLARTQMAEDIRARAIQEANFMQMQPLNILNALRTGNQVTMPQFGNWTAGSQVAAAPVYQAAQDQYAAAMQEYQAKMQGYGGLLSGVAGLGSAALLGPLAGVKK